MKPVGAYGQDKIGWTAVVVSFVVGLTVALCPAQTQARDDSIRVFIQQAGNADSDEQRLDYLKKLQKQRGLNESLKEDLARLITQIDRWVHEERLSYFGREVGQKKDFDFQIPESSPLYPLTWLYRGRMVIWYTMESGGVWSIAERRREFFDIARGFFEKAARAFPENKVVRMYLGHPTGPYKHQEVVSAAPQWAVYQREGLERLADIIEWWIDNRMQENGEYGGGWGDDCEMWRWWVPVLIGFDSPKITRAQARFSEALMAQPHMKLGYTTRMTDVEHTAEDSADVITPMMHLDPDNDLWRKRALRLAELMEVLWTGRNERGFLQFKSTYFTANKVDTNPKRACDTVYHPRAVQPTLLYWQRTGDPKLTKLFSAWMDTWVDAAARAERGKPAGILPTAIHWPDGRVGGLGTDWWDPRNHGEYTLYLYPSAMSLMTHTLLLTHHITGKAEYLQPIRSMANARLKYLSRPPKKQDIRLSSVEAPAPGTEAWCASRLGDISSAIAKYRFLTGSNEFDELIAQERTPYMRFRLQGDLASLVSALRNNAEALRVNFEGYTSEVRYTDRVLRFPALFAGDGILGRPVPSIRTPNPSLLYSTVTGDPGSAAYFPLNAVRWLTPPRNIAALVTESGPSQFAAELFHFGRAKRSMSAEFYLIDPGKYTLTIATRENGEQKLLVTEEFVVQGRKTRVFFELPPRKTCVLHVCRRTTNQPSYEVPPGMPYGITDNKAASHSYSGKDKNSSIEETSFCDKWQNGKPDNIPKEIIPFFKPPREFADNFGNYQSPLKFNDGTPVKTPADWQKRRQEILTTWRNIMGTWPPLIDKPKVEYLAKQQRENFAQYEVRVEIAPNQQKVNGYLLVPDGSGPFPAVLVVYYDAETGAGLGKELRDFGFQLTKRGFITLSIGTPDFCSLRPPYKPLYQHSEGQIQLQPLSALGYVAANCYNFLANNPQVDPGRIGIIGHSYGGKWAMFASCLYEKFACAVWSDPGIVFDETRPNVNYWEPWYLGYESDKQRQRGIPDSTNPRTGAYKKLRLQGHDLHELHALMAPRPLLVSGGSEDPPERWKALNHTVAVNKLLGYTNRTAMTNRKGHSPTRQSNEQIYLFFEHFLKSAR